MYLSQHRAIFYLFFAAIRLNRNYRGRRKPFVEESELPQLEKLVRLYREMDINLEGIETITYLLQRMNEMQRQIVQLTNRLSMYENE